MEVQKDILIEDLINLKSSSISFLAEKGIRCIRCGEPIWGTLNDAAIEKGFSAKEIEDIVDELNQLD